MADYIKLNLADISDAVDTTSTLITALEEQKSAIAQLKTCLETDNDGLWAFGASLRLKKILEQVDSAHTALTTFNTIQEEYLDGLAEKTGATGVIEIDASHYRYGIEQLRAQIDAINNQGGWQWALLAALPIGLLDNISLITEQEKTEENARILSKIMDEIKPSYTEKLSDSLENLETVYTYHIEPLMTFDDDIATRASTAYEEAISPETKTEIFLGNALGQVQSFGVGLGTWLGDAATGAVEFLTSTETVDNLVNEIAGVFNWFMSQGAIALGGIFRYDETFYRQLLSDIRSGEIARKGFGDDLEYAFTQGVIESANEKGWSFALGNLLPEVILVVVSVAKVLKVSKYIDKSISQSLTDSPKRPPVPGYDDITSIKSIKELPQDVQDAYRGYAGHGWQGRRPGQTDGTRAGSGWGNRRSQLPTNDSSGESIIYQEWDVDELAQGHGRGTRRFVTGSDGSAYFTDDHYSTFIKIEEGK